MLIKLTKSSIRKWLYPVLAILNSYIFCSVDWEALQGFVFEDKAVFEQVLKTSDDLLSIDFTSFFSLLSNEVLWSLGVRILMFTFEVEIGTIFYAISFLTIFIFSILILRESKQLFLLLFLYSPVVIDFAFSQYRMALATALLYIVVMLKNRFIKGVLLFCTFFIHSSTFILLCIYFITIYVMKQREKGEMKMVFQITIYIIVLGLLIGLIGPLILSLIGDRRAIYSDITSGKFMILFWCFFLGVYLMDIKSIASDKVVMLCYAFILFFITFSILGKYGARFIAFAYPLIISTIARLDFRTRLISGISLFSFNILYWIYWL